MKTKVISLILVYLSSVSSFLFSQTEFVRQYGGNSHDIGTSVLQTSDGGYVVAGNTLSFGAGGWDVFVIKTNDQGDTLWAKTYGTAMADGYSVWGKGGPSIIASSDRGYLIATTNAGGINANQDAYLIKIDTSGNIQWSRNYGGYGVDATFSVIQKSNDNYVFVGFLDSLFIGVGGRQGVYIGEIKQDGMYVGGTIMGDTVSETKGFSIAPAGSGFIVAGYNSSWIPVSGFVDGACLLKFDNSGGLEWQVCIDSIPGYGSDGYAAIQAADGGFVMTGATALSFATGTDFFLLKTTSSGTVQWTKTFGTVTADVPHAIVRSNDSGFLIVGESAGAGIYAVKTDSAGNLQWSRIYMGVGAIGNDAKNTNDGGFIITGSVNNGFYNDIILIKTDAMGNTCFGVSNTSTVQVDTTLFTDSRVYHLGMPTISQAAATRITNPTNYYFPFCVTTGMKEQDASSRIPENFLLQQNYPNPFNPSTRISYSIQHAGFVTLKVYDVLGNEVATRVSQHQSPGEYEIEFNAEKASGNKQLSSGVYFYRLRTEMFAETKKMLLLK